MKKITLKVYIFSLFVFLNGCTTAMYADKSISNDQVALIKCKNAVITFVDDVKVPYGGGNFAKVKVLPGERKITLSLNDVSRRRESTSDLSTFFNAQAGQVYVAKPAYENQYWYPVIVEAVTDKIVSYQK